MMWVVVVFMQLPGSHGSTAIACKDAACVERVSQQAWAAPGVFEVKVFAPGVYAAFPFGGVPVYREERRT
jgi:hypothetical protein